MSFSPIVKQVFVASAPLLAGLSVGGSVTYPTVLLHQLKRNDTEITLDFDTASWIGAIHGFAGIPSNLMPTIMQCKGRKNALQLSIGISLLGWILAYTAKSPGVLLLSESLHGFGSNSILGIACLSISEIIAPAYRDPALQLYIILQLTGMALNGLLTYYLHWKTICIIMGTPMLIALIIACMWPESPYWLAYKGEFEKCQKVFLWLRGNDDDSMNELRQLVRVQRESFSKIKSKKDSGLKHFWNTIANKDFYVPMTHIFILQCLVYGSGSMALLIYSIEIFQRACSSENIVFYGSFIGNGSQILGTLITLFINRYLKKKTILLASTFSAAVSLVCASAAFFLMTIGTLPRDSLISVYFISLYFISISIGVMPITYCTASELMPVKHRGIGGVVFLTNTCVLHTVTLKLLPYFLLYIDVYGTFLIFAFNSLLCGALIWRYIPDTQGRTLREIESNYIQAADMSLCESEINIVEKLELIKRT